jgi:hypothetical protein
MTPDRLEAALGPLNTKITADSVTQPDDGSLKYV